MSLPTQTAYVVGDPLTATRLNKTNADIFSIFLEIAGENLSLSYDIQGQLSQVIDNENSRTYNLDWTAFADSVPKIYIQRAGDPKKHTITYDANGYPSSIIYA